jgi:hypothetical protein
MAVVRSSFYPFDAVPKRNWDPRLWARVPVAVISLPGLPASAREGPILCPFRVQLILDRRVHMTARGSPFCVGDHHLLLRGKERKGGGLLTMVSRFTFSSRRERFPGVCAEHKLLAGSTNASGNRQIRPGHPFS